MNRYCRIRYILSFMPYRVELDEPFVRVCFTGTLTPSDLLGVGLALARHQHDLGREPDRLVDLSGVEATGVAFKLVMAAARYRRIEHFPNAFRSALFAPTETSHGFARIFQTINKNPQIEIRVFASMNEAEAWLGESVDN